MSKNTHSIPTFSRSSLSVYLRLIKAAQPYWVYFALGIAGTILATVADSGLAWAVKPLVDQGLVAREKFFLEILPFVVIAAFILRGITLFASNYYIARVGRSVIMDFRQAVFGHMLRLPASYYDKSTGGHLLALVMYNTEQLAASTTDALITVLQEGMLLIGLLIVMFLMSWQLTLLFLVSAPLMSIVIRYSTKRLRALSSRVQHTVGDVTHIAEETIEGYKVIRLFNGENYEREKFNQATKNNRSCEMKVIMTNSLSTSLVQIIAAFPIAFILYMATSPSLHISVGSFGAMVVAIIRLLTPMRRLTKVNTDIQKGIAAANSIFNLLEESPEKDTGIKTLPRAKGKIIYQDVHFSYPNAHKEILRGVNISIEPGETVALVGRSGGGKSTLINLLPRFFDINSGTIFLDGHNIQEYQLKELRKQLALVSQHVVLFNDTIANNIAYGRFSEAKMEDIEKAAAMAYLLDFIKQLPDGFNTMIGEKGLLLSGGQRQRLAIARALMKDAPILIMDEATSSLDSESEHHIQAALDELMKRHTTLVIAHRLSTVEKANKIFVIDQGLVVENGSHQELLKTDGIYAKLYQLQFKQAAKTTKQN